MLLYIKLISFRAYNATYDDDDDILIYIYIYILPGDSYNISAVRCMQESNKHIYRFAHTDIKTVIRTR